MEKHLTIEEIEKYINNRTEDVSLEWFRETLDHIMTCDDCQDRMSNYIQINRICGDDGKMLAVGLEELAKSNASKEDKKKLTDKMLKWFKKDKK